MLQSTSVFIAAEKRAIRSTFQVFVSELARVTSKCYKQCGKVEKQETIELQNACSKVLLIALTVFAAGS